MIKRWTHEVMIRNVGIGGKNPVRIQSMTNIRTNDVDGNITQIEKLVGAGCEIVRITVPTLEDVKFFEKIKIGLNNKSFNIPLVADVHFLQNVAYECLQLADKVRINPGNFSATPSHAKTFDYAKHEMQENFKKFLEAAKKFNTPIRIGVNQGSLSTRIKGKFSDPAIAMFESAREYIEIAQEIAFDKIIFSFKSSDLRTTMSAYRFADAEMQKHNWTYPMHVGVTEAGHGQYGIIKSSIAIGGLLADGIGDTIRVSLTGDPIEEIPIAQDILQATSTRYFHPEIISCPSCGRTMYDITSVVQTVEKNIRQIHTNRHIKIAIMGCIVNGLGEANDADIACIGTSAGTANIYIHGNLVEKNVEIHVLPNRLESLIETI